MGINYSPKIVTNGLVLCLDAANPSSYSGSGSVWKDLVNDAQATLYNGPTYSRTNAGSLSFDGTNDYITLNKSISDFGITSNATLSFWANVTLLNRWTGLLGFSSISGFGSTAANFSLDLNPDNNIRIWKNNTAIFGGSIISNNTWNLYSITSSSDGFAFYFNSSLINSAATAGNITSTNSLIIGDNWDNSLQGSVSSVMLYNKTLSLLEIQQNYNATKGRFNL